MHTIGSPDRPPVAGHRVRSALLERAPPEADATPPLAAPPRCLPPSPADAWREFEIGSFLHPPVRVRRIGSGLIPSSDKACELAASGMHFVAMPGVELQLDSTQLDGQL